MHKLQVHFFSRFVEVFREALFPSRCLVCKMFIHSSDYFDKPKFPTPHLYLLPPSQLFADQMTQFLCPTCRSDFLPIEPPICPACGAMFESRAGDNHFCGECIASPPKIRRVRSFGLYDLALMTAIHWFKYKTKVGLAHPLGLLLFSALVRFWRKDEIDFIVPVPLYFKKQRKRGFNQSFLLIKNWQKYAALYAEPIVIRTEHNLLCRNRWTDPQTGLKRKERLINIKDAFTVSDPLKVRNKNILLVDDVYTTGATVSECATVLFRAGANVVDVLTLARTR